MQLELFGRRADMAALVAGAAGFVAGPWRWPRVSQQQLPTRFTWPTVPVNAPAIGLYGRSRRYAAVVEDGVVTHVQIDRPGECSLSTGEALLEAV